MFSGQVPVYSLSEPDEFSEEKLVAGSLFDQSTAIGPDHDVYLKHRDVFKGVWFSYRNVDVNTDLEVEQCSERMIVGETRLLLTADVIHRLLAFMRSFFESLEASPLLSRGQSIHYLFSLHLLFFLSLFLLLRGVCYW